MAIVETVVTTKKAQITASVAFPDFTHEVVDPERGLIIQVGLNTINGPGGAEPHVTAITFDAVAMTEVASPGITQGNNLRGQTWVLVTPNLGTKTVSVTFSALAGAETAEVTVVARSYSGSDQTDLIHGVNFAGSGDGTNAITVGIVRPSTNLIVDLCTAREDHAQSPAGSDQTEIERQSQGAGTAQVKVVASFAAGKSPGSVVMSWGFGAGGPSDEWVTQAVVVLPGEKRDIPTEVTTPPSAGVVGLFNGVEASPAFLQAETSRSRRVRFIA